MTTYTDVFGSETLVPSKFGYQALSLTANATLVWPYNTDGGVAVSKIMDVSSTSAVDITLPDATEVSTGEDLLVRNTGSFVLTVKDSTGGTLGTVAAGAAKYFYLTSNATAAGTWAVIAYGVGTSSADAASLIGYGIIALGASLSQAHPVVATASSITIATTHRASLVNYTGGTGTIALTAAATLGDNFFVLMRNSGTGVLTIDPNGSETIDGQTTLLLQPGESTIIFCSGAAFFTVGLGRSLTYNFTQLVKDVSAGGSFTLSASEASNKLIKFIGNPTGAVTVTVPSIVAVYYVLSALSTAQTITVKTSTGSGTAVSQNSRAILICDSTDVYSAQTVDISTIVSLPDGSDAAPSLSFSSQTNTGFYKYGADGFGFSVNGVARYTDDGTTIKIGTLTGIVKRASGVESAATAGTDYVVPGGALGTPSGGTLTNCTGLPQAGVTGLTTADSPQFAGVNIGHATDTTLTRVSAGVVAVEGSAVLLASGSNSIWQAYDANTAKTNVAQTFSAKQTLAHTLKVQQVLEKETITASAPTGTFDCLTQGIQYFTSNASTNWTQNFRGDGSNTLNSIMAIGESLTCTIKATQGATSYYPSAHQIDGTSVTPKWLGGTAPTSGDASSINVYTYTILKTADATFTVLASKSKYA